MGEFEEIKDPIGEIKDPIKGTDYSLEITTPAQMEAFLKEFNLEMIEISEYLNEVESMINKERDIFIKSKELNKDFESRKGNLDNFAKNLDSSRSEEITRLEAELNEEIEAAAQIKTKINEESAKIEVSIAEIDGFDAKLAEESVYKSLGTAYNRMKKEYDAIGDVAGRDLSKEYESVLLESKNPAEIVAEKGVDEDYSQNNDSFFEHAKPSTP
jgi:DNA repair ATPase RecN